eukprot:scaffold2140_cov394-Prasinococcus_capsulatus_cf.AAC.13
MLVAGNRAAYAHAQNNEASQTRTHKQVEEEDACYAAAKVGTRRSHPAADWWYTLQQDSQTTPPSPAERCCRHRRRDRRAQSLNKVVVPPPGRAATYTPPRRGRCRRGSGAGEERLSSQPRSTADLFMDEFQFMCQGRSHPPR